ncbi:MAG: acyl-CoA ligase (AMP-forming), exosortase A system-associated [Betaproteobacteria bacterium]|nr:acyl-CoA ligase (AMP-forming), exosortase A system-associated [Betaproteobacteria bacterium]
MTEATLLSELVTRAARLSPHACALTSDIGSLSYEELGHAVLQFASGLAALGLARGDRVAIYLDKRFETVIGSFGASAAGAVFVPVNPILKPDQVAHILRDSNARALLTSPERLSLLESVLPDCKDLRHLLITGATFDAVARRAAANGGLHLVSWKTLLEGVGKPVHRVIDVDMAAILYTSGAKSVASYLENNAHDTLLAALPLSFDAGFSQLTTAFHAGARVVLLNYLMPRDIVRAIDREQVTGLTAVPPLYIQLAQLDWPQGAQNHLRYFANTGGRMPRATLALLRERLPKSRPFLMYGLTEAFRSTYLPPDQVDERPDSIGKAIPNAEILVLREDGSACGTDEPGELVHRGALVGMGYWNDAAKTAERYKLLARDAPGQSAALALPEYAVFSGDTVRMDAQGYLYFIGRRDEMMKTSGYRVSPTEVEEIVYATQLVGECAAFGTEHPTLGHAIQLVATPRPRDSDSALGDEQLAGALLAECRLRMPTYMVPAGIFITCGPLPRNVNGKLDRPLISGNWGSQADQ